MKLPGAPAAWRQRMAARTAVTGATKSQVPRKDWVIVALSAITLVSTSYQFYFKELLSPQRKPTSLEVQATLQAVGEHAGLLSVQLTVRASNATDRRVYVPALWFVVMGVKQAAAPCLAGTDWQAALADNPPSATGAFNPAQAFEPVAQRRLFIGGTAWFEPKDVSQHADIVAVPAGRYSYLKLKVYSIASRDVTALSAEEPVVWSADAGYWRADPVFRGLGASAPAGSVAAAALFERQSRWVDEAGGGINEYEVVLSLPGAARDAVPKRDGAGAELPAC